MSDVLVRVVAPHFVAGLVMDGSRCVHAAPKLKWAVGKSHGELRAYFARRGWTATVVRSLTERKLSTHPD